METTKEKLNPEIFSETFQKDFPYPINAYFDIFGGIPKGFEFNFLPDAEEALENALKTISPQESQSEDLYWNDLSTQAVSEIFMLRYKESMTLRGIAEHYGNLTENEIQLILAKTLRLLRHPKRSRNLKDKFEIKELQ